MTVWKLLGDSTDCLGESEASSSAAVPCAHSHVGCVGWALLPQGEGEGLPVAAGSAGRQHPHRRENSQEFHGFCRDTGSGFISQFSSKV